MATKDLKADRLAETVVDDALAAGKNPPAAEVQQPSDVMKAQLRRGEEIARSPRTTTT